MASMFPSHFEGWTPLPTAVVRAGRIRGRIRFGACQSAVLDQMKFLTASAFDRQVLLDDLHSAWVV